MAHNHAEHMMMNHSDHAHMGHDMTMDHSQMGHGTMDHHNHENLAASVVPDGTGEGGGGGGGVCGSAMHHGMSMAFHGGYCEIVLFESWKISTVGGMIGSIIGIMIMAALYEGLKYYREYLFWKTYNALQYRSVTMPSEKNVVAEDNRVVQPTMFSWMHSFQTLLHIIQIVLSYFLMLIFMTYNVWLCFAVVLGAAIGYFLFGWKKSVIVDVTEHCH